MYHFIYDNSATNYLPPIYNYWNKEQATHYILEFLLFIYHYAMDACCTWVYYFFSKRERNEHRFSNTTGSHVTQHTPWELCQPKCAPDLYSATITEPTTWHSNPRTIRSPHWGQLMHIKISALIISWWQHEKLQTQHFMPLNTPHTSTQAPSPCEKNVFHLFCLSASGKQHL